MLTVIIVFTAITTLLAVTGLYLNHHGGVTKTKGVSPFLLTLERGLSPAAHISLPIPTSRTSSCPHYTPTSHWGLFCLGVKLHRQRRDGGQLSLTSTLSLSLLLSPEMGLISRTPGICFISHGISQGTSGTVSLVQLWTTPKHVMVQSKRFCPTLEREKPKWWGGNSSGEKKARSSLKLLEEKKRGW